MILKDKGIILKHSNTGEADRIVTILTQHNGKIRAILKGCRKPKSRFVNTSELFTVSEFILYKGNSDLIQVSQADLKESYFEIRNDLLGLSYATYFAELVDIAADEDVESERLFSLLAWALHYISKKTIGTGLVSLAFQLKLMELTGYKPSLLRCANCHEDVADSEVFSVLMGGMLCKICSPLDRKSKRLSVPARLNMLQTLDIQMSALESLKIENSAFLEMDKIMVEFIKQHIGRIPKSASFLDSLKNSGIT